MSYKIVHAIKKSKLPAPLKRVLEAYVSFGNADGTNIRPTQAKVGERASCSRRTVERYTPVLVGLGVLVHDRNEDGTYKTYNYPKPGVWAFVYHADIAPLLKPEVIAGFDFQREALSEKRRKAVAKAARNRSKMAETPPDTLAESPSDILAETYPDSLSHRPEEVFPPRGSDPIQTDPSAVSTAGLVSSLVSSDDSLRSSSSLTEETLASLEQQKQNPDGSQPESIEPQPVFTIDGKLYEVVDGKLRESDDQTEEDKAETDAYFQIVDEKNIAMLLGVPRFGEQHNDALTRMAKVLVARNRSARWLYFMVKWMKEHKAFWAKRLHAGHHAIDQLAKHIESGACCDQFDASLALKNPDSLTPSKYGNELLFRDPLKAQPKHDPWLEPTGSTGWVLENGTLLRPVNEKDAPAGFSVEEAE